MDVSISTILGINFSELSGSRKTSKTFDARSIPLKFIAFHTIDVNLLNTAFAALVGVVFDGLPLDTIECSPLGGGVWNCEALFSLRIPTASQNTDDAEALGIAYAVDLTAGQIHITQSLETISTSSGGINLATVGFGNIVRPDGIGVAASDVGATVTVTGPAPTWTPGVYTIIGFDLAAGTWTLSGSPAAADEEGGAWSATTGPNYRQAIGVTKDSVTGTDIFAPKFEFSLTVKTYPVTLDFLRLIAAATATTNNATWKGFARGSVLYLGCTGQAQPDDFWTLTHKFAVGQNKTLFSVSPSIKVSKKAWEYLWCGYGPSVSSGLVLNTPRVAKVERVYEESNFDLLRLNPPIADFTSDVIGGLHPLLVNFTDLSTGTPLTWLWTFGDGTFSVLRNPSKVYTVPGVYTVSLTVTSGAGSSFITRFNYITVS